MTVYEDKIVVSPLSLAHDITSIAVDMFRESLSVDIPSELFNQIREMATARIALAMGDPDAYIRHRS